MRRSPSVTIPSYRLDPDATGQLDPTAGGVVQVTTASGDTAPRTSGCPPDSQRCPRLQDGPDELPAPATSGAARLRPLRHDHPMTDLHAAAERRIGAPAEQV
jgi:hypothetical protein